MEQTAPNGANELPRGLANALIAKIPETVYVLDPAGIITYINDGIRAFGYAPDSLVGRPLSDIFNPEDVLKHSAHALEGFKGQSTGPDSAPRLFDERRTGERMTCHLTLPIPCGSDRAVVRHAEIFAAGFYSRTSSEALDFRGTIGTIRDVTKPFLTTAMAQKLSAAVEQSPAIVAITDASGIVEYINPRFLAFMGWDSKRICGNLLPLFEPGDNPSQGEMMSALHSGENWTGDVIGKKTCGESFCADVTMSVIRNETGVTNFLVMGVDATEKKLLSPYFSTDVAKKILSGGLDNVIRGENLIATVLFFDIRGFTRISESLDPSLVADLLNLIFSDVMDLVFSHAGSINKLIGDAILATFGCPVTSGRDARNAAECALAIRDTIEFFNMLKPSYLRDDLKFGIGIATGRVFAGNIGSYRRMEYTVIGDTVNTASRLQNRTKKLDTDILIDEETRRALDDSYICKDAGLQKLRGKARPLGVYSIQRSSDECSAEKNMLFSARG